MSPLSASFTFHLPAASNALLLSLFVQLFISSSNMCMQVAFNLHHVIMTSHTSWLSPMVQSRTTGHKKLSASRIANARRQLLILHCAAIEQKPPPYHMQIVLWTPILLLHLLGSSDIVAAASQLATPSFVACRQFSHHHHGFLFPSPIVWHMCSSTGTLLTGALLHAQHQQCTNVRSATASNPHASPRDWSIYILQGPVLHQQIHS